MSINLISCDKAKLKRFVTSALKIHVQVDFLVCSQYQRSLSKSIKYHKI
ncbi:hypothetical protein PI95_013400 [Hassallia byssoidea VB512170]|uniref:Uncharacterized protein n=1 Tax=Hassallia byssoidea VB512170 TaxID=1304833 RepID=A0A846H8Z6_9CYAN|nr:hypothetical protein [Hassalia byssoidea VB512170]